MKRATQVVYRDLHSSYCVALDSYFVYLVKVDVVLARFTRFLITLIIFLSAFTESICNNLLKMPRVPLF